MNTTAHTIISSSIATGLAFFTFLSAAFAGLAATSTIVGISLFVMFGVIEIMAQSYAPPSGVLSRPRHTTSHGASRAVVNFPSATTDRKAA